MANNPGSAEARSELDRIAWERYTCTRGAANKFWCVRHSGRHLETWWGRIGTDGQRHVKTWPGFGGCVEAGSAYDELCRAKRAKGYALEPERDTWAALYQGRFAVGTPRRITDAMGGACANMIQQRVVERRVLALVEAGGGRETVMSERGSGLGELVVSREPRDGLLDALRDVRNGGPGAPIIHRRGQQQMLRPPDAAEVVTGSADYGYEPPGEPTTTETIGSFAAMIAGSPTAAVVRAAEQIEELALRERLTLPAEWQSHLVDDAEDGLVRRLYYREIRPDDRRIAEVPWLKLLRAGEPETPLRLRLCGRFLGLWEVGFSGPRTREYKEALSRPLSAEGAASLAFYGILADALTRGYLPEGAIAVRAATPPATSPKQPARPVHNPQGTVALARFAGIGTGEEEEI